MTITLNVAPGMKVLELGGGHNRNPASTINVDVRPGPGVDFTADFDKPLPIQSDEFDCVLMVFCLEHISYRAIPAFLKEVLRVLKPGCKFVCITANTEAQVAWLKNNPTGWDGKRLFESASCKLFGDQDYDANAHKCYFSPAILMELFQEAGFVNILTQPYGARDTDIAIEATKPETPVVGAGPEVGKAVIQTTGGLAPAPAQPQQTLPPEKLFDRHYFDGGTKVGGYKSYSDFPCHETTARHVLYRRPESVLELGCARGYVGKRLEDAGVIYHGMDVSRHCFLSRVCNSVYEWDICKTPWPEFAILAIEDKHDLCFSIATLEHIPPQHIPAVIKEMARTCKRGLHGITFELRDNTDQTRVSIFPKSWWQAQFEAHAPGWPVELYEKDELESGNLPEEYLRGDGKLKLNLCSFTTMFHHGWINIDQHDLANSFAVPNRYHYTRHDLRNPLPYNTGTVDMIFQHHGLEHFTYKEGLALLRDCRRVIKPTGVMRIVVPSLAYLADLYTHRNTDNYPRLSDMDEINHEAAEETEPAAKLHALLQGGDHKAFYDGPTLIDALKNAGWTGHVAGFRTIAPEFAASHAFQQLLRETTEMTFGGLSLFVDAIPTIGK